MLNPLPINGASAVMISDPQEQEPEFLALCDGPGCNEWVYAGDKDALRDEDGKYYCCPECRVAREIKDGALKRVSEGRN